MIVKFRKIVIGLLCLILLICSNSIVYAAPSNQNFDSISDISDIMDLEFTTDDGSVCIKSNVSAEPGLDGNVISNYDTLGSTSPKEFVISASDLDDNFIIGSLYILYEEGTEPLTGIDIYAYDGGPSGTLVNYSNMFNFKDSRAYSDFTYTNLVYDDVNKLYGGKIEFNENWADIDTIVLRSDSSAPLTISIDSLEFVPIPTISIGDITADEEDGTADFPVRLSNAVPMDVDYTIMTTTPNTATPDVDFESGTVDVMIPAGETEAIASIPLIDDSTYEEDEYFSVYIFAALIGANLGSEIAGVCTITDGSDLPDIALSLSDPSISENGESATLQATSAFPISDDLYVDLNFTGTATGSDYSVSNTTITIPAGSTTGTTTITSIDNSNYETDKTIIIDVDQTGPLGDVSYSSSTSPVTLTITEDDAFTYPDLTMSNISVLEGNSGSSTATFTLNLSSSFPNNVLIDYATSDLSATAGSDYDSISGSITFLPGETSKTVSVVINGDLEIESDETFRLNFLNPTNIDTYDPYKTCTILNDDSIPALTSSSPSVTEGSSGTTITMSFSFTLSHASTDPVSFDYETEDISATAGDYIAASGTVTFDPGETSKSVLITAVGDDEIESDETLRLLITNVTNATYDGAEPIGTIINDDVEDVAPAAQSNHSHRKTTDPVATAKGESGITYEVGTISNNSKETTITLIESKTLDMLSREGDSSTVLFAVDNNSNAITEKLTGIIVKAMAEKNTTLQIKSGDVIYSIPTSSINIDNVASQYGTPVDLRDILVNIKISDSTTSTANLVKVTAKQHGYQVIGTPVTFNIECVAGNKTIDVSRFNRYIEKMIRIPAGIDPSEISTGVVVNEDGSLSHVPTSIIKGSDGKNYARILSMSNSTYAVIENPTSFNDVPSHWAKDVINEMGSRLILGGVGGNKFAPDKSITRAEFATIIVRALGLQKADSFIRFKDVNSNNVHYSSIITAYENGILQGYTNGKFGPNDLITREQAMVMLANAMKVTGIIPSISTTNSLALDQFKDATNVSSWATDDASLCINNGLIVGNKGKILPRQDISRAESVTMIYRLLERSGLILPY